MPNDNRTVCPAATASPRTHRTATTRQNQVVTSPGSPLPPPVPDTFDTLRPPPPNDAGALPLGLRSGKELVIAADGMIRPAAGPDPTPEAAIETLASLAQDNKTEAIALRSVTEPSLLWRVVDQLSATHARYLAAPANDTQALQFRDGRASILSITEAAAVRAGELNDNGLRDGILSRLANLIQREPFRPLQNFLCTSLTQLAQAGKLPMLVGLREVAFPTEPATKKLPKGATISFIHYCDDSGTKLVDLVAFLKSLRLKCEELPNGDYRFTAPGRPGVRPVEHLVKKPQPDQKPSTFEKANEPALQGFVGWGHSHFNRGAEHAVAHGATGTGDGKIFILYSCWSERDIEVIKRTYPGAQVIGATEMTSDDLDQIQFKVIHEGLRRDWDLPTIDEKTIEALKKAVDRGEMEPDSSFHFETHYVYPHQIAATGEHLNWDSDSQPDTADHIFNVVYPTRVDSAGGYDPMVQAVPDRALSGEALAASVRDLSLAMNYNRFLGQAPTVPWGQEVAEAKGVFRAADGDLRAFRFSEDPVTHKLGVELSTGFAHTSKEDLARMLAYEAGLYLGAKAGLDAAGQVALGLALLDRTMGQQGGHNEWYASTGMLDEPWAEETLLFQRYGLAGISLAEVRTALGIQGDDDGNDRNFQSLLARVRTSPELAQAAQAQPRRVGTELAIPVEVRLPPSELDESAFQSALARLNIQGAAESYSPKRLARGQPNNVVLSVRDPAGKTLQIGMGLDSEGVVRSLARLDLRLDRLKEQTVDDYLASFAEQTRLSRDAILAERKRASDGGKSLDQALAAALLWARPQIPVGTEVPGPAKIEELVDNGYSGAAEWKEATGVVGRAFPSGDASRAEAQAFSWMDAMADAAGADKALLRQTYLRELAATGAGPGRAIATALALLPNPLPAAGERPTVGALMAAQLVGNSDAPALVAELRQRAGLTDGALMRDLLDQMLHPWGANLKPACLGAADRAIAENKPPRDILVAMAQAARETDSWSRLNIDFTLLQSLGVLNQADLTALAPTLEPMGYHVV